MRQYYRGYMKQYAWTLRQDELLKHTENYALWMNIKATKKVQEVKSKMNFWRAQRTMPSGWASKLTRRRRQSRASLAWHSMKSTWPPGLPLASMETEKVAREANNFEGSQPCTPFCGVAWLQVQTEQSSKQLVLMRKGGKGGNDTYKFSREAMATTSQFGPSTLAGSQAHGGWYVGSIQLNERPSVLCIQEASCWDQQWLALQHVMRSYGYRGFHTGGWKIGEKHEQRPWHRGILTFIDEKMEANWLGECSWKGGQFHAIAVDKLWSSTTIVLLKLIPSCNRFEDFLEQVQWQGNWIIMGDFNEVYDRS